MKTARNERNHEIFRISWNSCYGVPKPCAIAHEIVQKWPESRVFYDFMKLVLRGSGPFETTSDPKTVCYSPQNRPGMTEITSFFTILWNSCYGVPDRLNRPRTPKSSAIAHENGQEWTKSRNFYDFVKLVLRGPRPFKSIPEPKTVCYSPRKRQERAWITSFLPFDETRVTVSRPFKSTPDPKNVWYSPRKRPEMAWIMRFLQLDETRVSGSGLFKSTLNPKTVCDSPRKRPEMAGITSFLRFYATRVTGSRTF